VKLFGKKTKILIVGDQGAVLERLEGRVRLFWPADVPAKTVAVYCGWAEEAIEAVKEYQPDILLLNHAFRNDEKTGRDVARWIDENYRRPLRVAVHGDLPQAELRRLYAGAECVTHVMSGEGVRDFIEGCTGRARDG
jgi:hypothetical protein